MSHGYKYYVLPLAVENRCTVTGGKCRVHRNTLRLTHRAQTPHIDGQEPKLYRGGGVTANNRTPASGRQWDYLFFSLIPLFSKNFCMCCAVWILVTT